MNYFSIVKTTIANLTGSRSRTRKLVEEFVDFEVVLLDQLVTTGFELLQSDGGDEIDARYSTLRANM